jgi:hypothetical protein
MTGFSHWEPQRLKPIKLSISHRRGCSYPARDVICCCLLTISAHMEGRAPSPARGESKPHE